MFFSKNRRLKGTIQKVFGKRNMYINHEPAMERSKCVSGLASCSQNAWEKPASQSCTKVGYILQTLTEAGVFFQHHSSKHEIGGVLIWDVQR